MCGQGRSPAPPHSQGLPRGRAAPLAALRRRGQGGSRHRTAPPPAGLAAAGRSVRGRTGPGAARGIPYVVVPRLVIVRWPLPTLPGPAAAAWSGRSPVARHEKNTPGAGPGAAAPASRRAEWREPPSPSPAACEPPRDIFSLFFHPPPPPPRHRTRRSTPHARAHAARPRRHRTPAPTPQLNKSQKYNCNDTFDSEIVASILVLDNDHLRIIVTRHEDNGLVAFVVDHNDSVPSDFIPCVLRH